MAARPTAAAMVLLAAVALSPLVQEVGPSYAAQTESSCAAGGAELALTASDNKFDKDCLAAPADQPFTIALDNQDRGLPHNVSIYDPNNKNKALFKGEIIYGPDKITYSVPAQPQGTYRFVCDPHSEFMLGTLVIGQGEVPSSSTSTTVPSSTTTTSSTPGFPDAPGPYA